MTYQGQDPPFAVRLPDEGWYPDPALTDTERYWSGTQWTSRTRDRITKIERVPFTYVPPAPARPQRRAARRLLPWVLTLAMVVLYLGWSGRIEIAIPTPSIGAPVRPANVDVEYATFGSNDLVKYLAGALVAQEERINVSFWSGADGVTMDDLSDAMLEASTQNPYVFVDAWTVVETAGGMTSVEPEYTYDDAEAERRRSTTAAAVLAGVKASGALSTNDPEASAKAIHDYIVKAAEYDFEASDAIAADPRDPSARVRQSQEAYGILVEGTAVCNGYAQAFQLMADAAGLESVIVTGDVSEGFTTGGHAWNLLNVDGSWRVVDVTWDDGDSFRTDHDYFLIAQDDSLLSTRTADNDWVVDAQLSAYPG